MRKLQKLSAGRLRPTIRDVSRLAGVSTATVSRVMSGLGGASEATRQRIYKAVKDLGYQANRMASGLRATRTKVVGVVIPDLQNPFFAGIVGGIETVLEDEGYTLFLVNSGDRLEREAFELEALLSERVSGILIIPCESAAPHYGCLARSDTPVVAIDRVPDEVAMDSVTCANEAGAFQAVSRFMEAGRRDVGLINGPSRFRVSREREAGYLAALKACGVRKRVTWMLSGDFQSESGYELTKKLLSGRMRPSAVVIGNFMMALGAVQAIREMGLSVPRDLALIAFDDMPWATAMNPPLSVVDQPVHEMGKTAARLLLERLENPEQATRRIVLEANLIVRESCGTQQKVEGK